MAKSFARNYSTYRTSRSGYQQKIIFRNSTIPRNSGLLVVPVNERGEQVYGDKV